MHNEGVTPIMKEMIDKFVKDTGLRGDKLAIDSRRNEISRVLCSE